MTDGLKLVGMNMKREDIDREWKKMLAGREFPRAAGAVKRKLNAGSISLDEARKELDDIYDPDFTKRDFPIGARCNIIATNQPIENWAVSKLSAYTQNFIYSLTKNEFDTLPPLTGKSAHQEFFALVEAKMNCPKPEFNDVQTINQLLNNIKSIYKGVIERLENKRSKAIDRAKRKGEDTPVIEIFTPEGFLAEKPGISDVLYGVKQSNTRPLHPIDDRAIIEQLPPEYRQYSRHPRENIYQLPWIPSSGKNGRSDSKRRRLRGNTSGAILFVANFGADWVVFDARGLLRQVNWRKDRLSKDRLDEIGYRKELTIQGLAKLFTGNPVVFPSLGNVALSFREVVVNQPTLEVVSYKKFKFELEKLTAKQKVFIFTHDLGATVPVAHRLTELSKNAKPIATRVGSIDQKFIDELSICKRNWDKLGADIRKEAISKLLQTMQDEIAIYDASNAEIAKAKLFEIYHIPNDLPWDKMTDRTHFIADFMEKNGFDEKIFRIHLNEGKNGKKDKKVKCSDFRFAMKVKSHLSTETNNALNTAIWEIQKQDKRYKKLSTRRKELIRYIRNTIIRQAKNESNCDILVIAIENLTMTGGMWDTKGQRKPGWNNFFLPKKNNDWFIKDFHRAFSELAPNKGIIVVEYNPAFTSKTCPNPECLHCDADNRAGIRFVCKKCGYEGHADIDVATFNGEKVVLTGTRLPGYERPSATKKRRGARKGQVREITGKIQRPLPNSTITPIQRRNRSQTIV